jgi:hypothetical protein
MGTGGSKPNEGNDQLAVIDNSYNSAGGADITSTNNTNTNNNYRSTNTATSSTVLNYTSTNLNEYIVKPSDGCWFGCFATKQNVFIETNWNGLKPNVTELSHHSPSCGLWFGIFCRKMIPKHKKNTSNRKKNNNTKAKNSTRSTMVCDGGGWCHSDKHRTVLKIVLQDELTKGGSKKKGSGGS